MQLREVNDFRTEIDEDNEDEAFVTYDIATYPSDFTLSGIEELWKNKTLVIPDFQREYVWHIKQASLLIESFLLGLPVPPVFFYIDEDNKSLVIDGQQRILSSIFYFQGFFGPENSKGKRKVFRLYGLNEKSPYYKKTFEELPESDQRKLRSCVLRAINVRQITPTEEQTSVYHIFERLNTGGTPLKAQEIRNVVFRGDIVRVLRKLNEDVNWRTIIGNKNIDKHQRDVELVLRLFAFTYCLEEYEKPMKDYLGKIMKKNKDAKTKNFKTFEEKFTLVTKYIVNELGEKPFNIRGPLNTSALDSVFCTLLKNFPKKPVDLKRKYEELKKIPEFEKFTTKGTTDTQTVKSRFELVEDKILK